VSDQADNLAAKLAPYRETPGIIAALLISHDGFIVAADAEDGFNADAVAAQVGGAIDLGARLAGELGQTAAKYICLEFDAINVVLAPFGDELMLALIGLPSTLTCEFRLNTTQA
jgi:predicted regulator of Ras-like GTPase activity (Roadblock/LC7/MglB family)